MSKLREHPRYLLLGLMLSGGVAGAVAGSRMLQGDLTAAYAGTVNMPLGLTLFMFGCISFALSAGYLIRDIQSEEWGELDNDS